MTVMVNIQGAFLPLYKQYFLSDGKHKGWGAGTGLFYSEKPASSSLLIHALAGLRTVNMTSPATPTATALLCSTTLLSSQAQIKAPTFLVLSHKLCFSWTPEMVTASLPIVSPFLYAKSLAKVTGHTDAGSRRSRTAAGALLLQEVSPNHLSGQYQDIVKCSLVLFVCFGSVWSKELDLILMGTS